MSIERFLDNIYTEKPGAREAGKVKAPKRSEKRSLVKSLLRLRPSYWLRRLPLSKKLSYYTVIGLVLLIAGGVVVFQIIFPNKGEAAWYDPSWSYRMKLTIDNSGQAENLTDFPVLVKLTSSNFTFSQANSDGSDVRLTDSDGVTLLSYQIESWSDTTDEAYIHVKVPQIDQSSNTDYIYIYWGNTSATDGQDASAVWDSNFRGVWHLSQTPPASISDSTSNGRNGTSVNMEAGDQLSAEINGGLDFDGSNERVDLTASSDFIPSSNAPITVSLWLNPDAIGVGDYVQRSLSIADSGTTSSLILGFDNTNQAYYYDGATRRQFSGTFTPGTWYHLAVTYSGTQAQLYKNGVADGGLITHSLSAGAATTTKLGTHVNGASNPYNGKTDEVRISGVARSAPWMKAQYLSDTDTYLTYGSAESSSVMQEIAYWAFDEATGTTAHDSTESRADGTLTGTTTPSWTAQDQCISQSCLFFDGITSNITVADTSLRVKSISFWVNPSSSNSAQLLKLNSNTDIRASSGTISAPGISSPTIYVNGVQSTTLTANTWNYVTVTTGTIFQASAITLGKGPLGVLKGFMDEVRLYDSQLTSSQVKDAFNARGSYGGSGAVLGAQDMAFLSDGLVGYWKLNESATPSLDSSGNGDSGTWGGSTAASGSAKFASGVTFDGNGDSVVVGDSALFSVNSTNLFTVAGWIKPLDIATRQSFVSKGTVSNYEWDFRIEADGGINANIFNSSGSTILQADTDATLTANTWTHVAFTVDLTNNVLRVYQNGELVAEDTTSTGLPYTNTTSQLQFGERDDSVHDYNGVLDEVRIYNRIFSPNEIENLYNFAPGPVGSWEFEEGQGTVVSDNSSYGNNGSWVGTGTNHWVIGKIGKGGGFNGTDDYVNVGDVTTFDDSGLMTFTGWFKQDALSTNKILLSRWEANQHQILFQTDNSASDELRLFFADSRTDVGSNYGNTSSLNLVAGQWYHIAVVYDGTQSGQSNRLKLFINGVQVTLGFTGTIPATLPALTAPTDMKLGANLANGRYFNGILDQTKIYHYPLTSKQVIQDMNGGHPSVGSPVGSALGYWKFDDGFGNVASNSGSMAGSANGGMYNFSSPASVTSGWTNDGKFDKALNFDGTDDYVDMGDMFHSDEITVCAWVNPRATAAQKTIVAKRNATGIAAGANLDWWFTVNSGKLFWQRSSSGTDAVTGATTLNTYRWYHACAVQNGIGEETYVYLNGQVDGQETQTNATTDSSSPIQVGVRTNNDNARYWSGMIDEVKIYNYALTASEVKLEYNHGSSLVLGNFGMDSSGVASNSASAVYCVPGDTTQACSPGGEWRFEEKRGGVANDTSGNSLNGVLVNSLPWEIGKVGSALRFNSALTGGSATYVNLGDNVRLERTVFTVSAWVYRTGDCGAFDVCTILSKGTSGNVGFTFDIDDNSGYRPRMNIRDLQNVYGSTIIQPNRWYHVAASIDGSTVKIYVNGALENSTAQTQTPTYSTETAKIGNANNGLDLGFEGIIDEVRYFNYALSGAQVAWDYNRGKPIVQYKFDECQGTAIHDSAVGTTSATLVLGSGGTTSAGTCSTPATAWGNGASGKFNYSVDLDGTDDQVTLPPSLNFWRDQMTWSVWVKFGSVSSSQPILELGNGSNGATMALAGSPRTFWVGFPGVDNIYTTTTPTAGQWYHVVFVADSTASGSDKSRIFINGKEASYGYNPGVTGTAATGGGRIGSTLYTSWFGPGVFLDGQVDDVQVFNYSLTPVQIRNLYNQSSAVRYGPITGAPQ